MARTTRFLRRWQIQFIIVLPLALLAVLADYRSAYAYEIDDGDRDDNEVVTSGPNVCTAIPNLPAYPNATCMMHETEREGSRTEVKNYYVTRDAVDTVRQAYEAAFSQHGWAVAAAEYDREDQEWEYTISQGQQYVEVTITAPRLAGEGTAIEMKEA